MSLTRRQFFAGAVSAAAVVVVAPALRQVAEWVPAPCGLTVADLIRARDVMLRNNARADHWHFLYASNGRLVPVIDANGAPRAARDILDEFYSRHG